MRSLGELSTPEQSNSRFRCPFPNPKMPGRDWITSSKAGTQARRYKATRLGPRFRERNPIPIPHLPPTGAKNRGRVVASLAVSGRVCDPAAVKLALKMPISKPKDAPRRLDYIPFRGDDDSRNDGGRDDGRGNDDGGNDGDRDDAGGDDVGANDGDRDDCDGGDERLWFIPPPPALHPQHARIVPCVRPPDSAVRAPRRDTPTAP